MLKTTHKPQTPVGTYLPGSFIARAFGGLCAYIRRVAQAHPLPWASLLEVGICDGIIRAWRLT